MRIIENFEYFINPVKDFIFEICVPTLMGIDTQLEKSFEKIISQPPKHGGIGITNLVQEANLQHQSSELVTKIQIESIMEQRMIMKELDLEGNTKNQLNKWCNG